MSKFPTRTAAYWFCFLSVFALLGNSATVHSQEPSSSWTAYFYNYETRAIEQVTDGTLVKTILTPLETSEENQPFEITVSRGGRYAAYLVWEEMPSFARYHYRLIDLTTRQILVDYSKSFENPVASLFLCRFNGDSIDESSNQSALILPSTPIVSESGDIHETAEILVFRFEPIIVTTEPRRLTSLELSFLSQPKPQSTTTDSAAFLPVIDWFYGSDLGFSLTNGGTCGESISSYILNLDSEIVESAPIFTNNYDMLDTTGEILKFGESIKLLELETRSTTDLFPAAEGTLSLAYFIQDGERILSFDLDSTDPDLSKMWVRLLERDGTLVNQIVMPYIRVYKWHDGFLYTFQENTPEESFTRTFSIYAVNTRTTFDRGVKIYEYQDPFLSGNTQVAYELLWMGDSLNNQN